MKVPPVKEKRVVVTGCSTGIGWACARMLKDRGWQVAATARKDEDLDRLRELELTAVRLDIADPESTESAAREILEVFGGRVGGLVNNAGFGQPGAVEDLSREAMRYQLEVNVIGMQAFTNRFIPLFRGQGWGRIVNISSVVGRISLPFFGIYSASKFAMEALSDVLRVELRDAGVAVCLVEPGPIASAFRANAVDRAGSDPRLTRSRFSALYRRELLRREKTDQDYKPFMKPPEAVGVKVVHALESNRPRTRYKVTLPAYLGAVLSRLAPDGLLDRLLWMRLARRLDSSRQETRD
jgi:NAD(P)-dependent dehydrogenase (short-subunit alcohol dehydrogenase family)